VVKQERLQVGNQQLHLAHLGAGPELWLALHGYGDDHRLFRFVGDFLPPNARLVLLDLPYFGQSQGELGAEKLDADWLVSFLTTLKAHFPDTRSIHLIGFSLGAKFALGLYQHSPFPIHQAILIAPDGLRLHPLYRFCIYNPVGKRLFKATLRRPGTFLFVLRSLYNLHIADAFKYRFVKRQFEKEERRKQLEKVWFGYAEIRPDLKEVARRTEEWDTHWHVIWGEKDTVLPVRLGNRFRKQVSNVELHLLASGHRLLHPPLDAVVTVLKKIINKA